MQSAALKVVYCSPQGGSVPTLSDGEGAKRV